MAESGPVVSDGAAAVGVTELSTRSTRDMMRAARLLKQAVTWRQRLLLDSPMAKRIYTAIRDLPIIDYHTHLPSEDIRQDRRFRNLGEILLGGDHYIWTLMRASGIPEELITGPNRNPQFASVEEKDEWEKKRFMAFAKAFPRWRGNQVYAWTRMALNDIFGVTEELNEKNAEAIWNHCNTLLARDDFSVRSLLKRANTEVVCTTDDPIDRLIDHAAVAEDPSITIKMLPTFRVNTDRADFREWVEKLGTASGITIATYDDYVAALQERHDFFALNDCKTCDFGHQDFYDVRGLDLEQVKGLFARWIGGEALAEDEVRQIRAATFYEVAKMNAHKGWVQMFHFGPRRNVNTLGRENCGGRADIGFDTIGPPCNLVAAEGLLDRLTSEGALAKSIFFPINSADYTPLASLIFRFQGMPGVVCPLQLGVPWWQNDNVAGNHTWVKVVNSQGFLRGAIGMLSDSRSFLSVVRFDFFARGLASGLAELVRLGQIETEEHAIEVARAVCYENKKTYFRF